MKTIPLQTLLDIRDKLEPCTHLVGISSPHFDTLLNVSEVIGILNYWIRRASEGVDVEITK